MAKPKQASSENHEVIRRPESRQPLPESANLVFKGELFDVYQWQQVLFDGRSATFEKLKRPDTAYVIPILDNGKLLLVKQEQPGAKPVIGLIGGRVEKRELPIEGARRELMEETGIRAESLMLWDSFQFLPKIDWAIYIFLARGCSRVSNQSLDGGERIQMVETSFDGLVELVGREEFGDLEVALHFLRLSCEPKKMEAARSYFSIPNS